MAEQIEVYDNGQVFGNQSMFYTLTKKALDAMKLMVEWRNMKDLCAEREDCSGCPYYARLVCDLVSTEEMIDSVANIFTEYLAGISD